MQKTKVLVSLDSMRYPNTGLYYFGKSLGEALIRQNKHKYDLQYLLSPKAAEFERGDVKKEYFKPYHKLFYFNKSNIGLFHFTDQHSRLKPQNVGSGKKIVTIHDINKAHENPGDKQLKIYIDKLAKRLHACDKIIAISQFVANDVLYYYPQLAGKIQVIYNGADKLEVNAAHVPVYKPQKPFLFAIGIIWPKKNFHVLPALLAGNDYELIIAGILTPYKDAILDNAKKFGVEGRVKFTGPVSENDRAWYYKNCEAFVFPSIAEGFGLPVIEAMHFGKPVFVSTFTSLPEVAGDAAYYFDTFEPDDMQNVFTKGMHHFYESDRQAYVTAYANKYNWDNTANQYLDMYRQCLDGV